MNIQVTDYSQTLIAIGKNSTKYALNFRCMHDRINIIKSNVWPIGYSSVYCFDCNGSELTEDDIQTILEGQDSE